MNYYDEENGRIDLHASSRGSFATFEDVQAQLVEAMELWMRSPGDGRWPFAGDGPWHLVRDDGSEQAAWDARVNQHERAKAGDVPPPRRLPLSIEEVERRDLISEWIQLAPERDRKLVALVLAWKARTPNKPVEWKRIRQRLIRSGEPAITARGLGMRYSRAITAIVRSLKTADFCADGVSR
jgi:hypothetical protein